MAQVQHIPIPPYLEEEITVLFCLVDDAYKHEIRLKSAWMSCRLRLPMVIDKVSDSLGLIDWRGSHTQARPLAGRSKCVRGP